MIIETVTCDLKPGVIVQNNDDTISLVFAVICDEDVMIIHVFNAHGFRTYHSHKDCYWYVIR